MYSTEPRNVIGGYTAAGWNFSATLIGDYKERALKYVAKVHAGFTRRCGWPFSSDSMASKRRTCPFKILSEAPRGQ